MGFDAELLHINALMENPGIIHRYSFVNLPGGFLDGDDLGAAKAQAVRWKYQEIGDEGKRFIDEVLKFVADGKIMLGICNGFQLLAKTGLLPGLDGRYGNQPVTLTFNDSGNSKTDGSISRWTDNRNVSLQRVWIRIYLPVRHGEGKFVTDTAETMTLMKQNGHVALQYADESGDDYDGVSRKPERLGGGRSRDLRRHGEDIRTYAASGGIRDLHAAPAMDEGKAGCGRRRPDEYSGMRSLTQWKIDRRYLTMNKTDIINKLAEDLKLNQKIAKIAVDNILDTIKKAIVDGKRVEIRGFGNFSLRQYKAYKGRNPKSGDVVNVEPKKLPYFKVGKELKDMIWKK